jgi:hypothetical protein
MIEAVAGLSFGKTGDAARAAIRGFSSPEDGFTWSVGREAALLVDFGSGPAPTMIELDVSPFIVGTDHPRQGLTLRINGVKVAADRIERAGTLGYWLPKNIVMKSPCLVEFIQPDAVPPRDFGISTDERRLGFMFRHLRFLRAPREPPFDGRRLPPPWDHAAAPEPPAALEETVTGACGLSLRELMFAFESLGCNCEFGVLQRTCGAEPLSLLRFAGIALPSLLQGLAADFAGIDDPALTRLELVGDAPREFLFRNDAYGMSAHTWRHEDRTDAAKMLEDVLRNMKFYQRKFREDLANGGRLYVFQRSGQLLPAHALPLLTALRRHGDCSLLFVCESADVPSGTVAQLSPHLFQGFIGKLAPGENVALSDLPSWLSLCVNAWRLWKGYPDQPPM